MTKENLEIYQEVFPKSQLRRMKVVDEYLNTFGEMIKKKVISPNCAFEALAKKYELTRAGIRVMLTKAGVCTKAARSRFIILLPKNEQPNQLTSLI